MKEKVTLNVKEQKRLLVLNEILAGRMTGQHAAEMLGVTLRYTRRMLAKYRREGAAGVHKQNTRVESDDGPICFKSAWLFLSELRFEYREKVVTLLELMPGLESS